jgi:hypothetical protein
MSMLIKICQASNIELSVKWRLNKTFEVETFVLTSW